MPYEIAKETFLYEQVADRISVLIRQGTLRAGERVPSVRSVSLQERVSISTALQAYFLLENQGLIEARPQSGFYVRRQPPRPLPQPGKSRPPLTVARGGVGDLAASVVAMNRNPGVVPLGAAMPSPELFPNRKLQRLLSSVARGAGPAGNAYDIPPGNEELRRQIARHSVNSGCALSPEDLVITAGATEALNLCLRAVARPGDVIAVESPTYFLVPQIIEGLGMKAVEIATGPREGICLDALAAAIEKRNIRACVVMPTVHNPLGGSMPDRKKKRLVAMLAQKEIPLIEDDIWGDLYFDAPRPRTAKAFDQEGLVLLCSSFSKTLAPGYRIGWIAPGRFRSEVARLKMINTMGNPVVVQMMLAEFLGGGGYDQHLRRLRKAYASQVQLGLDAVSRYFPPGTRVTRPSGGFVLWVEFPAGVDTLELHRRALEKKISIAPGPIFSAGQGYPNAARLNCGNIWTDRLESAFRTLGELAAG